MRLSLYSRAALGSLAMVLGLSACEPAPPAENPEPSDVPVTPSEARSTQQPIASGPASPAPADGGDASQSGPLPTATTANGDPAVADPHDLLPDPLTGDAQKGEKGARNVLLGFARALELGDLRVAYALTDTAYREQHDEAEFRRMFAALGDITVEAPIGRMEGAAGSSYYSVPATIAGDSGRKLNGIIALRRVNDVPGATAYQRNWHVTSVDLKPVG